MQHQQQSTHPADNYLARKRRNLVSIEPVPADIGNADFDAVITRAHFNPITGERLEDEKLGLNLAQLTIARDQFAQVHEQQRQQVLEQVLEQQQAVMEEIETLLADLRGAMSVWAAVEVEDMEEVVSQMSIGEEVTTKEVTTKETKDNSPQKAKK
jgi:hypothetical protein